VVLGLGELTTTTTSFWVGIIFILVVWELFLLLEKREKKNGRKNWNKNDFKDKK